MKKVSYDYDIYAQDDLWEYMDTNQKFNDFIGQCITHFIHFVIPRRDQTLEIQQDYPVPLDIDDVGGDLVMLTRKDRSNTIIVEFWRW